MTGRVVTTFPDRGYSFILYQGKEVFAHRSDYPLSKILPVGSQVEFELGDHDGRPKAINIHLLPEVANE
jgi:cold shock CspA family protein